jgi:hypothetical protein
MSDSHNAHYGTTSTVPLIVLEIRLNVRETNGSKLFRDDCSAQMCEENPTWVKIKMVVAYG